VDGVDGSHTGNLPAWVMEVCSGGLMVIGSTRME